MVLRLVEGILLSRWIIAYLGLDSYGLWTLLWSFFGYSRLLDFGLGVTALKYTATKLFQSDIKCYNSAISTVFTFYFFMSFVVIGITYVASFFVVDILKLDNASTAHIEYCRTCFLVFGIGAALIFPTGIFPELLVGLQKIYLRNYITGISSIIELSGVLLIFFNGGGLLSLIVFILVASIITNIIMLLFAGNLIPGFKLRFKISVGQFKEIFKFSGLVYLGTVFRIIGTRSELLLISIFYGLEPVGIFQMGQRLPLLMSQGTGAYHENIIPISASLHAAGKKSLLTTILINSIRWNSFLATGAMAGIFWFAPEAIRFLFKVESETAVYVCRVSLGSVYTTLVFRTIIEKFMLMTNRHGILAFIITMESTAILVLCLLLIRKFDFVCVAWTVLGVKLFITSVVVLPLFLKYLKIGWFKLLMLVSVKPLIAVLPTLAVFHGLSYYDENWSDFVLLLLSGGVGGICYIATSYFVVLNSKERNFIKRKIMKRLRP